MQDDDYTSEERRLFDALPRSMDLPAELEGRLVERLRQKGFFRMGRRQRLYVGLACAASLLLGVWLGTAFEARRSIEAGVSQPQTEAQAASESVKMAGLLWF